MNQLPKYRSDVLVQLERVLFPVQGQSFARRAARGELFLALHATATAAVERGRTVAPCAVHAPLHALLALGAPDRPVQNAMASRSVFILA